MLLLGLCSLIGCYAVLRQLLFLAFNRVNPDTLSHRIIQDVSQNGTAATITALESRKQPVSRIMAATLRYQDRRFIQPLISEYTPADPSAVINSVITIAPLLGLLGTVLGLIDIFNVLSGGALDNTEQLSSGIAQALLTTVIGLAISVPLIIAAAFIDRKTEQFLNRLDSAIERVIRACNTV